MGSRTQDLNHLERLRDARHKIKQFQEGEFCETLDRPEKVARIQNGDRVVRGAHERPENERKPLSKSSNRSPKPSPKSATKNPNRTREPLHPQASLAEERSGVPEQSTPASGPARFHGVDVLALQLSTRRTIHRTRPQGIVQTSLSYNTDQLVSNVMLDAYLLAMALKKANEPTGPRTQTVLVGT
ncbi:hypothetical protein NDU88_009078 [Pleurodeles waltl]|uniref:Uncharacterized protein n=1 Tax=Pleurodeles waltl TaxID=8319 RepID=A0AAV7QUB1_PLEWA|nr:hypothetical protein NDU88_009078 [Pleurodeles waltl]